MTTCETGNINVTVPPVELFEKVAPLKWFYYWLYFRFLFIKHWWWSLWWQI